MKFTRDNLNENEQKYLSKAYRFERAGWIFLHIEGAPFERGFQHGYLLAKELAEALKTIKFTSEWDTGDTFNYFENAAIRLYNHWLENELDGEFKTELEGIVSGALKAGVEISYPEILAWNANIELLGNWWPLDRNTQPGEFMQGHHCNSFIATGDQITADGGIVLAHNTWDTYINSNSANIVMDIHPDNGNSILMQSAPGFLHSGTDFFLTGIGIIGSETSIAGFSGYDEKKAPEFYRVRKAMQYAQSLDEWMEIMQDNNNGGYANSWLIGDIRTGEIARLELGLKYVGITRKKEGYFWGCNVVEDPRIRNQECDNVGYSNVLKSGGRRVRWEQLLAKYCGKIDIESAKAMISDDYDVYLKEHNSSNRTICARFDRDPAPFTPLEFGPYYPYGANDGKVTDSTMAKQMSFLGRYGHPDGSTFNAKQFLEEQPQYAWQAEFLKDKLHQPWVNFSAHDKGII
ncbi:MAG TPA: phospholipase [Cyanobacteria bacterium UBA11369]|nr:phospholipase [Cyanobacteria bacterium UBA11371]HBE31822.1 phospholipase [Cyanobacteria bacterium UBA11368]HBE53450.1 phospholipase [Cyanobacteria bacterium UBA11369]